MLPSLDRVFLLSEIPTIKLRRYCSGSILKSAGNFAGKKFCHQVVLLQHCSVDVRLMMAWQLSGKPNFLASQITSYSMVCAESLFRPQQHYILITFHQIALNKHTQIYTLINVRNQNFKPQDIIVSAWLRQCACTCLARLRPYILCVTRPTLTSNPL